MASQQLLDYLKQQLQQGASREIITNNLISQGWQSSDSVNASIGAYMGATGQHSLINKFLNKETGQQTETAQTTPPTQSGPSKTDYIVNNKIRKENYYG